MSASFNETPNSRSGARRGSIATGRGNRHHRRDTGWAGEPAPLGREPPGTDRHQPMWAEQRRQLVVARIDAPCPGWKPGVATPASWRVSQSTKIATARVPRPTWLRRPARRDTRHQAHRHRPRGPYGGSAASRDVGQPPHAARRTSPTRCRRARTNGAGSVSAVRVHLVPLNDARCRDNPGSREGQTIRGRFWISPEPAFDLQFLCSGDRI
jgi:hypothetical protein